MSTRSILATSVAVLFLASAALADTVEFANGDRVTGSITGVESGRLVVEVPGAGVIRPDPEAIASVTTASPFLLVTKGGTQAAGTVEWLGEGRVRLVTGDGTMEIALADIRRLEPDPALSALDESIGAYVDVLGEETAKVKSPWSFQIQLGANYSSGNTDEIGLNFRTDAKHDTDRDTFTGEFWILYSEKDGDRVSNQQYLGLREDIKLQDPWSVFGSLTLNKNEFEDLDLRATFTVGASYWARKDEDFELRFDLGPALTYEDYEGRDSEWKGEAFGGVWAKWAVLEKAEVSEDLRWFQSMSDWPDYRFSSVTSFTNPLNESLFLKLDVIFQYNTVTNPGVKRLDTTLLLSLVWKF